MAFDITPTTSAATQTFTNAAGVSTTITLYKPDGKGLLPGASVLIQREVDTGVWQTYGTLNHANDSQMFDGEGDWRVSKAASAEAFGVKGN